MVQIRMALEELFVEELSFAHVLENEHFHHEVSQLFCVLKVVFRENFGVMLQKYWLKLFSLLVIIVKDNFQKWLSAREKIFQDDLMAIDLVSLLAKAVWVEESSLS